MPSVGVSRGCADTHKSTRHLMPTLSRFLGVSPQVHDSVFVADNATLVGDVHIGARSTIWYGAVLRGDVHYIRIGSETSIQDNTVVHVTHNRFPVEVGDRVTVGTQLSIRATPGTSATLITQVQPNTQFTVLAGPQTADGLTWFQLRSDDGSIEGWAAEGDGTTRWISPLE